MSNLIGYVDVDAGMLLVGDPCYHVQSEPHEKWIEWLRKNVGWPDSDNTEFVLNHEMGHSGAGVVLQTAYGDGSYPVYKIGQGSFVVITDDVRDVINDLMELAKSLENQIDDEDDYNEV